MKSFKMVHFGWKRVDLAYQQFGGPLALIMNLHKDSSRLFNRKFNS